MHLISKLLESAKVRLNDRDMGFGKSVTLFVLQGQENVGFSSPLHGYVKSHSNKILKKMPSAHTVIGKMGDFLVRNRRNWYHFCQKLV